MLCPNRKSDVIIITSGISKAIFLLLKQAPENNAIAYTAVKLSACGIRRVKTPINIKAVIIKFVFSFTFDVLLNIHFKFIKISEKVLFILGRINKY